MMSCGPFLAVCYDSDLVKEKAYNIATRLGVPAFYNQVSDEFELMISVTTDHISLRENPDQGKGPVYVDLVSGPLDYRRRFGGQQKGQLLIKAIGGGHKNVLDCTTGLGRDAFIMASHGCRVTTVERSEVLAILINDGLSRAKETAQVSKICENINFVSGDARMIINKIPLLPWDVIYIDPMYPAKKRSALPKKEMQVLQRLLGTSALSHESESEELVEKARLISPRVVVKRPKGAPPLLKSSVTSMIFKGQSTRYDVYVNTSL